MTVVEPVPDSLAVRAGTLFGRFRDGDETQMEALVRLLTPILWHTVRAQNLDARASEDVLQSTWLALVRNAQSITEPRAVLQWLIVTCRREAWRSVKAERKVQPADFEDDVLVAPAHFSPEDVTLATAERGTLWAHISALSARCRELLRVIAFADRPDYAAVAAALDMPVGSIGPTRGRCLATLRALLDADPAWTG